MLLIILSVLMFICVIAFGLGGLLFLAGACSESNSEFIGLSGLSSLIGLIGMFLLTIPYLMITGY